METANKAAAAAVVAKDIGIQAVVVASGAATHNQVCHIRFNHHRHSNGPHSRDTRHNNSSGCNGNRRVQHSKGHKHSHNSIRAMDKMPAGKVAPVNNGDSNK